jgi:hypothetical protein
LPHDWSELVNRIGFLEDLSLFKKDSTWTISFLHKKSEILILTSFQLDETTDNVLAYRVYENLRHQQDAVNHFFIQRTAKLDSHSVTVGRPLLAVHEPGQGEVRQSLLDRLGGVFEQVHPDNPRFEIRFSGDQYLRGPLTVAYCACEQNV